VAQDIFAVMQQEEAYNEQRYIAALHSLPDRVVCGCVAATLLDADDQPRSTIRQVRYTRDTERTEHA